jgi:hypothetical protein
MLKVTKTLALVFLLPTLGLSQGTYFPSRASAGGGTPDPNSVDSTKIADGTVAGSDIAAGAVLNSKIATSAVDSNKVKPSNITSTDIKDGEVNTLDLADGSVTAAKLAAGVGGISVQTARDSTGGNSNGARTFWPIIVSNTNTLADGFYFDVTSSGTPAVGSPGFGSNIVWRLENATVQQVDAGKIGVHWRSPTHAARNAAMTFSVSNVGTFTERFRIMKDGVNANDGVSDDYNSTSIFAVLSTDSVTTRPSTKIQNASTVGDVAIGFETPSSNGYTLGIDNSLTGDPFELHSLDQGSGLPTLNAKNNRIFRTYQHSVGTNIAPTAGLQFDAPRATGNATSGSIIFTTGQTGASGSTRQTAINRVVISVDGTSTAASTDSIFNAVGGHFNRGLKVDQKLTIKSLNIGDTTGVVLTAPGVIAVSGANQVVDSFASAALDTVTDLSGVSIGDIILFRSRDGARDITFVDGATFNMASGNFILTDPRDIIMFVVTALGQYTELTRRDNN